jgi:hypothetical protein
MISPFLLIISDLRLLSCGVDGAGRGGEGREGRVEREGESRGREGECERMTGPVCTQQALEIRYGSGARRDCRMRPAHPKV